MKKIGSGWQYVVYDMGNGRVRKVFRNRLSAYLHIGRVVLKDRPRDLFRIPEFARSMRTKATKSIQTVIGNGINPTLLGNPVFINETDYEQDLLIPLETRLQSATETEGRALIDTFVQFNQQLITLGIADKSFNIGKNFAVSAEDKIMLVDFGELIVGSEAISAHLLKRTWQNHYVVGTIPTLLRSYFLQQMDTTFLPLACKK